MSVPHEILRIVSEATGIPACDIVGTQRVRPIADARLATYVGLRRRGLTLENIGRLVGGRGHSTVQHGLQAAYRLVSVDRKFRQLLEVVK